MRADSYLGRRQNDFNHPHRRRRYLRWLLDDVPDTEEIGLTVEIED